MDAPDQHWVFGYGSLMWRPGFAFVERRRAVLHGKRRAFCIYSVHHRGAPERPGLVLGLVPGGLVRGIAFRVEAERWPEARDYLLEREQPTETYLADCAEVYLDDGRAVASLVFLSDIGHPQWAGDLGLDEQAGLIAHAEGLSGRNLDYLRELVGHLRNEGRSDLHMELLLQKAEAVAGEKVRTAA